MIAQSKKVVASIEAQITETHAELVALREEKQRRASEFPREIRTLRSEYEALKACLNKTSNQLNISFYKNAILKARTVAVQPYVLTKEAVLCHALHQYEVATKQVRLMQLQNDEIVSLMHFSSRQVEDFWESRLWGCDQEIQQVKEEIEELTALITEEPGQISEEHKEDDIHSLGDESFEKQYHAKLLNALSLAVAFGGFEGVSGSKIYSTGCQKLGPKRKPLEAIWEEQATATIGFVQRRT